MADEDDDDTRRSEDEILEEDIRPDDMFNPDLDEEKLPDDFDPPAAPTPSRFDNILKTHPITDDPSDRDEIYNEGLGEATGLSDSEFDSDNSPARPLDPEE